MSILYTHRLDFNNAGDVWSGPYHYTQKPGLIMDLFNPVPVSEIKTLIVGGGAILCNNRMISNLKKMLDTYDFKFKVFWGGGVTLSEETTEILKRFDFVGCRDYNKGLNFLPCPSVMHPALKQKITSNKDFLIIDHWKRIPIEFSKQHTRIKNRFISVDDIINQISLHNYIITSSYHAAYWGIVLGKKVIVITNDNFEKFTFKQEITVAQKWNDKFLDLAKKYSDAYEECLFLNKNFLNELINNNVL